MGWDRAKRQGNSRTSHIQRKKRVFCRAILFQVWFKFMERTVSTDGETGFPQACRFLRIKHNIHSPLGKSLIERTMQYIKDRTECFDDYFPCRKKRCKLKHIKNWMRFFVEYHNNQLESVKWTEPNCLFFSLILIFSSRLLFINYYSITSRCVF